MLSRLSSFIPLATRESTNIYIIYIYIIFLQSATNISGPFVVFPPSGWWGHSKRPSSELRVKRNASTCWQRHGASGAMRTLIDIQLDNYKLLKWKELENLASFPIFVERSTHFREKWKNSLVDHWRSSQFLRYKEWERCGIHKLTTVEAGTLTVVPIGVQNSSLTNLKPPMLEGWSS